MDRWRKSTYSSSNGGDCVEVGHASPDIAVRDTRQHGEGPVLRFTPQQWKAFLSGIRNS